MANKFNRNCQICNKSFSGRKGAKTCSSTCRKRLQRARRLVRDETAKLQKNLSTAEQDIKGLERLIVPESTTQAGFIIDQEPHKPAIPIKPSEYVGPQSTDHSDRGVLKPGRKQGWKSWVAGALLLLLIGLIATSLALGTSNRSELDNLNNQVSFNPITVVLGRLANGINSLKDRVSKLEKQPAVNGTTGGQGPAGAQGLAGNNGAPGQNGTAGQNGADGQTGPAGPQGPSGAASCANGPCLSLQPGTPGVQETGNVNISGTLIAGFLQGDGTGITNVDAVTLSGQPLSYFTNASNITSGTLSNSQLSASVTLAGNSFNGISQLVKLDGSGNLPALNGSALNSVNASQLNGQAASYYTNATNISTGTLSDSRLSANVTLQGNTFNGASQLVQLTAGGILPVLDGSNLTNVNATTLGGNLPAYYTNATNITTGTVNNARLTNSGALTVTAGTGLTGGGSVALGSSTTLNVAYGSTAGTAVEGNVNLTCPSGSGNLTGGGTVITLGTGGTCGAISITNSPTFTGTLAIQGGGGITVGAAATTAGVINLANATNSNLSVISAAAPSGIGNATYTLPSIAGGTADTICLATAGNCTAIGAAGGDLTGTYPNPTIAKLQGGTLTISTPTTGNVLQYNGSAWVNALITNVNLTAGTYTAITGTGALTAGSIGGSFGNINIGTNTFTGNGSGLTSLNATNISSGTLSDTRLSANVALLNGTGPQTFTGNNSFTGTFLAKNASNSTTAFQVQDSSANPYILVNTSGASLSLGNTGIASTIQIGNTTGAVAQTINIGNNATASSTSTVTIGNLLGSSATTLQAGSGGISLNGATTISNGNLGLGANSLTLTGSIASSGSRVTKGWFTDLDVTNTITGSVSGNAATVTGFSPTSGKTLTLQKSMTLTAADDTGVYTFPTGTATLLATNGSIDGLTGTISSSVLGNSSLFVGTTSIALNRPSASQALTGISIDGNAATATALQNARTIGGVSFDGTANITVASATGGFAVSGGDLTVTRTSTTALAVGRQGATSPALQVDSSTNATSVTGLKIVAGASGGGLALSEVGGGTDENLTLDAKGAGTITLGNTSTGGITLNRATTISNGNLGLGANSLTLTGSIASSGSRVTKGWFTDLDVTNTITGSVSGNAGTVTNGVYTNAANSLSNASPLTFTNAAFTGKNSVLYATQTTGAMSAVSTASSGLCLQSGASSPTWGSCSGAAVTFDQIGAGTNTNALLVGTGGSLDISGSGTIIATSLHTARTIGGVSFDGTANITVASATGGFAVSGGDLTVTRTSTTALAVGRQGATSPALQVDSSTNATSVTGLKIVAGASGGGLALSEVGGGTDENLTLDAKGAGTLTLQSVATGNIQFFSSSNRITSGGALTIAGAITAGTYNTTTLSGSALTFGTAGTATIQPASSQALNITAHATSTWKTDSGNLTVQTAAASSVLTLSTAGVGNLTSGSITIQTGDASGALSAPGTVTIDTGTSDINGGGTIKIGPSNAATVSVVSSSCSSSVCIAGNAGATTSIGNTTGAVTIEFNGTASRGVCKSGGASATGLLVLKACTGSITADYAELYPTESTVGQGDIVMSNGNYVTSKDGKYQLPVLKDTQTSYDSGAIGVISEQTLADNADEGALIGNNINSADHPQALALNGRVMTKVNTENGNIMPGDYITASSTPGVGMKATRAGEVVGRALAAYSGNGVGQILLFINPSYYNPDTNLQGDNGTFDLVTANSITVNTLTVNGIATFNGTIVVNGHIIGNPDTSGAVTVSAGSSSLTHTFSSSFDSVPNVVITPEIDPGNLRYWVTKDQNSFTIHLSGAAASDIKFDYFVQQ